VSEKIVEVETAAGSWLRDAFVIAALLVFSNGPLIFVAGHVLAGSTQWEDAPVRQVFAFSAFLAALAVALDSQRLGNRRLTRPPFVAAAAVLAFCLMIACSSFWSVEPALTRGRSVIYFGLAALAWIIADLGWQRVRSVLLVVLALLLGASLVVVLLSNPIGLDQNGDWRGLFGRSNELAALAGLAILIGLPTAWATRGRTRVLAGVVAVLGVVLLVNANSITVWVGFFGAVVVASLVWCSAVGLINYRRWAVRGAFGAGVVALVGAVVVVWNSSVLASRRDLWGAVWDRITEAPVLGYGWFTVWDTEDFSAVAGFAGSDSANNSFLEVWLGAGLLAVVPFVVVVALALWRACQALWRSPNWDTWTWMVIVVYLALLNLTLSFVLGFSYVWVLLMSAALQQPKSRSRDGVPQHVPQYRGAAGRARPAAKRPPSRSN